MLDSASEVFPDRPFTDTGDDRVASSPKSLAARVFKFNQETYMFHPRQGIEKMKSPLEYEELAKYPVTERELVTDDRLGHHANITLWEKKADEGKPHYIVFSGRSGHWADSGDTPMPVPGYDRRAGLKFLAEIAKSGAGFTAVTMRGYGNNSGHPGEEGFKKDIEVLVRDWLDNQDRVPSHRLIVAGYSMGTANATMAAAELTKQGEVPALLALANPFSHMAKLADEFISKNPKAKEMKLYLPEEVLEQNKMLRHEFRSDDRLTELSPDTHVFIATSGKDSMIDPSHSKRLIRVARQHGLKVEEQPYPECGHLNLPMEDLAQRIRSAFEASQEAAATPEARINRLVNMRDGVYIPPHRYLLREPRQERHARERHADEPHGQLTR